MSESAEIALMHRKQCIFLINIIFIRFNFPFLKLLGLKYGQMSCLAQKISPKSKIFQFSSDYHALCISFVVQTYLIIYLYILKHISVITKVIFECFWILLALLFGSGTRFYEFVNFWENTLYKFKENLVTQFFSNSPKLWYF